MAAKRQAEGTDHDYCKVKVKRPKPLAVIETDLIADGFLFSIENNDTAAVRDYLISGFDPSYSKVLHCLSLAVAKNNAEMVKLLLASNAKINIRKKPHESALCTAVASGNHDMVKLLISHGANIHQRDSNGECLLHVHLKSAIKAFGKVCRENPPKYREKYDDEDEDASVSEHWSPIYSNFTISLSDDLSPETKAKLLETEFRYFLTLKNLLEKDSSRINKFCCKNKTILCSWTMEAKDFIKQVTIFIKLLLQFGVDVNIPAKGKTPLYLAYLPILSTTYGVFRSEIPELFLMHGAKVDAIVRPNIRRSILHYLIRRNRGNELKTVLSYVNLDLNSEKYNYHALPLLHYAFHHNKEDVARVLLIAGANPFLKDKNNRSLFQLSDKKSFWGYDCFRLLVFYYSLAIQRDPEFPLTPAENREFKFDFSSYWYKHFHRLDMTEPISDKTLPVSILELFYASEKELMAIAQKYVPKNFHDKSGFGKRFSRNDCYDIIKERLERARDLVDILGQKDRAENILKLSNFLSPTKALDIQCLEKILNLLSFVDLRNLVRASEIGTFQEYFKGANIPDRTGGRTFRREWCREFMS